MHWYALSKTTGMATLCASEADARREASAYDRLYPLAAPHIATQLVPRAEYDRVMEVCRNAHDRLLRGDTDRELLDFLAEAWHAPSND